MRHQLHNFRRMIARYGFGGLAQKVSTSVRTRGLIGTLATVRAKLLPVYESIGKREPTGPGTWRKTWQPVSGYAFSPTTPASRALSFGSVVIVGDLYLPQCVRYRILQKIETLHGEGVQACYVDWRDFSRAMTILQTSEIAIFFRVPQHEGLDEMLAEASRLGIQTYYDIDDPIFARDVYSSSRNLDHIDNNLRAHLLATVDDYKSAMDKFQRLIVSTPALADLVSTRFGTVETPVDVYVWRNGLDGEMERTASMLAGQGANTGGSLTLGYFSGSLAHEADFAWAEAPLRSVLETYPNVQLLIMGHALADSLGRTFPKQVQRQEFASYTEYLASVARCHICLVPLEQDTFNDCKSAIRFLEAAMLGKLVICSRVGDFANLVKHKETGFLIDNSEWEGALHDVVRHYGTYCQLGEAARRDVRATLRISAPDETVVPAQLLKDLAGSGVGGKYRA